MNYSQKKRRTGSFLVPLFRKLAPKIGAKVVFEPAWNTVGQITFKNGKIKYFRGGRIDLNTLGASEIAVDKDYAAFFMRRLGFRTIPGKSFYSDKWHKAIGAKGRTKEDGYRYASRLGFPVIIKPNSGTQGHHVQAVYDKKTFLRGIKEIFRGDRVALVQKYIKELDYRIVVLDDKVISAYHRIPLNITGDGIHTIRELLIAKQKQFNKEGRGTRIKLQDPRILSKLKQEHYTLGSKPEPGKRVFLLDNANLSTGGDFVDVTTTIHKSVKDLAIKLTKDMGLRLCGVDIMIQGSITEQIKKYWIIEINAAPGLDHYIMKGKEQQKIVEDLYLQVLKNMAK